MQQEPLARSNREQWEIIFSCLEETGTRHGFNRKKDKIKHKIKYKWIRN